MVGEVVIRAADFDDVPQLASLRGGGSQLQETMLGYLRGTYSPSFAELDRAVFVATVENKFAGYVAGHRTSRFDCDGELQWLNVHEQYRGKGVADALMQKIIDWFLSNSMTKVCVNVDPGNIVARKVYQRHGAQELNEHWLYWPDMRMNHK